MFTPYAYVREEMRKALVRNMLASQFIRQGAEEAGCGDASPATVTA